MSKSEPSIITSKLFSELNVLLREEDTAEDKLLVLDDFLPLKEVTSEPSDTTLFIGALTKSLHSIVEREDVAEILGSPSVQDVIAVSFNIIAECGLDTVATLEETTVSDISTIVTMCRDSIPVVEHGIAALVNVASIHPYPVSMSLDFEFLCEQFSLPDLPSGVNYPFVVGSLNIMTVLASSVPAAITFEWIESLVLAVKNMSSARGCDVPLDYERALWKCIEISASESNDFAEYFMYVEDAAVCLAKCLLRQVNNLEPERLAVGAILCTAEVLSSLIEELTAAITNTMDADNMREETEGDNASAEDISTYIRSLYQMTTSVMKAQARADCDKLVEVSAAATNVSDALFKNILALYRSSIESSAGAISKDIIVSTLALLRPLVESEERSEHREALFGVVEVLFISAQLNEDDVVSDAAISDFISQVAMRHCCISSCSRLMLYLLNFPRLRAQLIEHHAKEYKEMLTVITNSFESGSLPAPLVLTTYQREIE